MTISEFEKAIVALACWRVGQRDGIAGMISVACMIRNRLCEVYPTPYLVVVTFPEMQPGFEVEGDEPYPDPRNPDFVTFLSKMDSVLCGSTKDITAGGVWYMRQASNDSPAFGLERVAILKDLSFYK